MSKEKNQVTTLAGKEDDTNSTATQTTATFTLCCESEWGDFTSDGVMESRTLRGTIPMILVKKIGETCRQVETPTPQVNTQSNLQSNPTQQFTLKIEKLKELLFLGA